MGRAINNPGLFPDQKYGRQRCQISQTHVFRTHALRSLSRDEYTVILNVVLRGAQCPNLKHSIRAFRRVQSLGDGSRYILLRAP